MESVRAIADAFWPRRKNARLLYLLILVIIIFSNACNSSERSNNTAVTATAETPARTESALPAASTATTPEPSPVEAPILPPPKAEEVRGALARVYEGAVTLDTSRQPPYVVGDFNGDGSEDIAIIVRPVKARLEEINNEFANWILEDPRQVTPPDPHKSVQPLPPAPQPLKVDGDDLLCAVIHGYKEAGWRNPEARQTYLLDYVAGNSMSAAPVKDLQKPPLTKNGPLKNGDVIKQTLDGEQGFLYWTGAKYGWKKQ